VRKEIHEDGETTMTATRERRVERRSGARVRSGGRGGRLGICLAVAVVADMSGLGDIAGSATNAEAVTLAYMGPGAGIAAVGALLAIGWLGFQTIVGLVWYPVRKGLQWWRARRDGSGALID